MLRFRGFCHAEVQVLLSCSGVGAFVMLRVRGFCHVEV